MFFIICVNASAQTTSHIPKETTNWLQVTGISSNGDVDGIHVILFEVPDTITSTLYFGINDPGCDDTWPDQDSTGFTDFYLVGGAGTLSDSNSRLIDYSGNEALSRTGTVLDSFQADSGGPYNNQWVYFSGVSPGQGEHIGSKYYFKVVVEADALIGKNAFQLDISYNNSGDPDGISGVRTFAYMWTLALDNRTAAPNTWEIFPFVPDGASGNIEYRNWDFDSEETMIAYDISGYNTTSIGAVTSSGQGTAWPADQAMTPFLIGAETNGTWALEITETNLPAYINTSELWFTNSDSGEVYRAYSSFFGSPSTPDHVDLSYDDGIAIADNSDTETVAIQIVNSNNDPTEYSRKIYVSVNNSGEITESSNGPVNSSSTVVTTDSTGLGYIKVKKSDSTAGNVTVTLLTDGNSGSHDFGPGVDDTIIISFVNNPDPTISSASNRTFSTVDPSTAIPQITLADSPNTANFTTGNDIRIRIPAGLDCIFTSITDLTGNLTVTGIGAVSNTVSYLGNNKTLLIDVTTDFAAGDTLDIDGLEFQTFDSESSGSLELSFDGGSGYPSIDDKVYSIVDNNPPTITARETADLDGDGSIDAVHITFSKNIKDSTVDASNFDIAVVAGETFSSTTNSDTADDNDIYITFADSVLATDAVPNVSYTAGTLTDLSGNPLGNSSVAATDGAGPAILSAVASDETNIMVGIDNDDTVTVSFSEDTNQPVIDAGNIDGVLVLSGGHVWVDGAGGIGSAVWSDAGTLVITLSTGTAVPSVAVADTITLDGATITGGTNVSATAAFSAISGSFSTGAIDSIAIRDAAGGEGNEIINIKVSLNDSITLYAAGYDAGGSYIADVNVTWDVTGTLDGIDSGPSTNVAFTPVTKKTSGTITADDGNGHTDTTGTIIVIDTADKKVIIRNNIINPKTGDLVYINFILKKSEKVNIRIFDLSGCQVKVLCNRKYSSGLNEVTWNGKNKRGKTVMRGDYYIVIKIGKKRYVKKVLVVK